MLQHPFDDRIMIARHPHRRNRLERIHQPDHVGGAELRLDEPRDLTPRSHAGFAPDVVIVATGGTPDLEWLDGAAHCTNVWDALSGNVPLAAEIIVYDGSGREVWRQQGKLDRNKAIAEIRKQLGRNR